MIVGQCSLSLRHKTKENQIPLCTVKTIYQLQAETAVLLRAAACLRSTDAQCSNVPWSGCGSLLLATETMWPIVKQLKFDHQMCHHSTKCRLGGKRAFMVPSAF